MNHKLPITVGIIGHLDAIITPQHEGVIERLFDDINSRYPNSPICLFSQLAPGADMTIAELFLNLKERHKRAYELIVPLPYERERYKLSFEKAADKEHFDVLLSKSAKHFILASEEIMDDNSRYRFGGQFVADSSMILIAIWKNGDKNKKGGTGDVVKYKIEGSFEDDNTESIFDARGSLIELPCNRENDGDPVEFILPVRPLIDIINDDKSIAKALEKTEALNKQDTKMDAHLISQSGVFLYPETGGLSRDNLLLREYFSLIDAQAISKQLQYKNSLGSLFIFGLLIIAVFECYKHMGQSIYLLCITASLLLLAFVVSRLSHYRKYHSIYLENRVLAEALRIQFFWNLGNVQKSVSNYILRIYKSEFNWLKHILQALRGVAHSEATLPTPFDDIVDHWLKSQSNYFNKKGKQIKKDERKYETVAGVSMLMAVVLLAVLISLYYFIGDEKEREKWLHRVIIGIGILFGLFALCKAYIEKKGYQQTINQYSLMADIFGAAINKIEDIRRGPEEASTKNERINTLLFLAGKEALIENGNWYLIYKEKEPEMEGLG